MVEPSHSSEHHDRIRRNRGRTPIGASGLRLRVLATNCHVDSPILRAQSSAAHEQQWVESLAPSAKSLRQSGLSWKFGGLASAYCGGCGDSCAYQSILRVKSIVVARRANNARAPASSA